jgi:hypothetical protein
VKPAAKIVLAGEGEGPIVKRRRSSTEVKWRATELERDPQEKILLRQNAAPAAFLRDASRAH